MHKPIEKSYVHWHIQVIAEKTQGWCVSMGASRHIRICIILLTNVQLKQTWKWCLHGEPISHLGNLPKIYSYVFTVYIVWIYLNHLRACMCVCSCSWNPAGNWYPGSTVTGVVFYNSTGELRSKWGQVFSLELFLDFEFMKENYLYASQLWGRRCGKVCSCLLMVGSLQYRTLTPTVCTGFLCPQNYPSWYDLYSVESDLNPNK